MKPHSIIHTVISIAAAGTVLAEEIPSKRVEFDKGSTGTVLSDKITGKDVLDYVLTAKAGQTMSLKLEAGTPSLCFNLLPPGDGAALHVGSRDGTIYTGKLPEDGDYSVRLYLMGNARDTGLTVPYKLQISIEDKGDAPPSTDFDQTLTLQGISFRVMTAVDDSGKLRLRVTPEGLEIDNSTAEVVIDGPVTGAEVADLNADGSPEIYVFDRSAGEEGRASVHAWSTNKKRSMSQVHLPDLTAEQQKGYRGGDGFAVVENSLVRRFTVDPAGKTRQIQYKLAAGEAGWLLKVDRVKGVSVKGVSP